MIFEIFKIILTRQTYGTDRAAGWCKIDILKGRSGQSSANAYFIVLQAIAIGQPGTANLRREEDSTVYQNTNGLIDKPQRFFYL
jgi:hypothetical protein